MIVCPKISVWATNSYQDPKELANLSPEEVASCTTLYASDMSEHGWVLVGEAKVEITLMSEEQLLQSRIEALRTRKAKFQAEATNKLEEFDHRIQQLLALPAPVEEYNDPF